MSANYKRIPTDPEVFEELNERKKDLSMKWDGLFMHLLRMEKEQNNEEQVSDAADRLERQAERIEDAAYRLEREQ